MKVPTLPWLRAEPARLPAHSLTRPTSFVFNADEVYSDCPHALRAASTRPCQIRAAPHPCVLPCALSDSGPGRRICQALAIAPYAPPLSHPTRCPCRVHGIPYTSQSTPMHLTAHLWPRPCPTQRMFSSTPQLYLRRPDTHRHMTTHLVHPRTPSMCRHPPTVCTSQPQHATHPQ